MRRRSACNSAPWLSGACKQLSGSLLAGALAGASGHSGTSACPPNAHARARRLVGAGGGGGRGHERLPVVAEYAAAARRLPHAQGGQRALCVVGRLQRWRRSGAGLAATGHRLSCWRPPTPARAVTVGGRRQRRPQRGLGCAGLAAFPPHAGCSRAACPLPSCPAASHTPGNTAPCSGGAAAGRCGVPRVIAFGQRTQDGMRLAPWWSAAGRQAGRTQWPGVRRRLARQQGRIRAAGARGHVRALNSRQRNVTRSRREAQSAVVRGICIVDSLYFLPVATRPAYEPVRRDKPAPGHWRCLAACRPPKWRNELIFTV